MKFLMINMIFKIVDEFWILYFVDVLICLFFKSMDILFMKVGDIVWIGVVLDIMFIVGWLYDVLK